MTIIAWPLPTLSIWLSNRSFPFFYHESYRLTLSYFIHSIMQSFFLLFYLIINPSSLRLFCSVYYFFAVSRLSFLLSNQSFFCVSLINLLFPSLFRPFYSDCHAVIFFCVLQWLFSNYSFLLLYSDNYLVILSSVLFSPLFNYSSFFLP